MNLRNLRFWATRVEKTKLNQYEVEMLNFLEAKKRLEIELQEKDNQLRVERETHRLNMRTERQNFDLEKEKIVQQLQLENEKLKSSFDIQQKDFLAAQVHKIIKIEQEAKDKLAQAINQHRAEMLEEREKWSKDSYDKLSLSMTKLHEEGNAQTRFVQEMATALLSQAPKINKLDIGVGTPKNMTEVNLNDNRENKS